MIVEIDEEQNKFLIIIRQAIAKYGRYEPADKFYAMRMFDSILLKFPKPK